ncbi:hypothetical protein ACHABX_05920 [Nesterenkonia halotolerans]|uniref:hypothetical protein n=1 Tax=Nesterenkonia halotolerans TaxID=225325 RepID=UPI003EE77DCE
MRGNFYLGGGSSETDEENVWTEAFIPGQTVAFWPFATTGAEARRTASNWFSSALASRGRFAIEQWISPADHDPALPGVDVVAIQVAILSTFCTSYALPTYSNPL